MAIALLLSEVGLRLLGFSYFNPYIVDPKLGYSLRPHAEGWWREEGLAYVKINSQGMRDYEHAIKKPGNTIRIAVLGDSFAEAFQVPAENAFWSVMQRQIQDAQISSGKTVEVLNFGVSGFSTARELIMLRERVWQYDPDVVVLLVFLGNDVRDNSRALTLYSSAPLPYFVYQNGSLILDDSLLKARNESIWFRLQKSVLGTAFDWVRAHSRLLGLVYRSREVYQSRVKEDENKDDRNPKLGLKKDFFREPVDEAWDEAWRVTEKLIVQMRDEVNAKGAKFLVVTASIGIQVNPDATMRAEYMRQLGVTTLFYPDTRIKELGEREHINVLTLAPLFQDFATRNQVHLHGFGETKDTGHWNENGHRIAGQLIAERVKQDL